METIYEKAERASNVLMEYYAYCELRRFIEDDWKREDTKFKAQCDKLYAEYEEASIKERDREENSKSARIAKKLETMKMADELVAKIKLRNSK